MKVVRKLDSVFSSPLEGYTLVTMSHGPVHEGAVTFNFPLSAGAKAEVRVSVQEAHEERPFMEAAPLRAASMDEVIEVVRRMYSMVACGTERAFDVELPVDEPEGFARARHLAGFAMSPREWMVAEVFFRAGMDAAGGGVQGE